MRLLTFDKNGLFFSVVAFFLFACNSTGFDFYSHSVSYYFYDSIINSSDLLFGHVVLPRYLMLSYLYEITSRVGIPVGWISAMLITYPIYNVAKILFKSSQHNNGDKCSVYVCVLIGSSFLLAFFYSGLSLVLLWFLSYLVTKKKVFLIGGLLHPVGIIIFLFGLLFLKKDFLRFVFMLTLTLMLFYVSSKFNLLTAASYENFRYELTLDSLSTTLSLVFEKKQTELMGLVVILLLSFFAKAKFLASINVLARVYIHKNLLKSSSIFLCVLFFFAMIGSPTLINSFLHFSYNDVIYAAWFDWGAKDLRVEHWELYMRRYQPL
ncbi:hypothetical protein L1077_06340 [Pseudoalteromonas luteoviolacea]|uniref:hypothetical protein n=1 Tax=Pseudoalteromonas luteoviolacea TaxID=43657 RepID=UPI001F172DD9|nr:hypothetical protein [Pseudoalteromonas luteoviolacea]MCF6439043.1 hypothetical protein [Pseudoalteromonas luteoviolacea]